MHISDPDDKVYSISICNIFGDLVLSSPMSGTVDLGTLASGIYTVRMFDNQNQCTYSSKITNL